MKNWKIGIGVLALAFMTSEANAWNYKLDLPKEINAHVVGARDLHNGAWMTGTSVEVLWFMRKDEDIPIAYLALNNLYDLNDATKGSFGGTIGFNVGKAGEVINRITVVILPDQSHRLNWLKTISNWASVEVGGGYRLFGPEPSSRWYYSIGGKVRVPIEKLWGGS